MGASNHAKKIYTVNICKVLCKENILITVHGSTLALNIFLMHLNYNNFKLLHVIKVQILMIFYSITIKQRSRNT